MFYEKEIDMKRTQSISDDSLSPNKIVELVNKVCKTLQKNRMFRLIKKLSNLEDDTMMKQFVYLN